MSLGDLLPCAVCAQHWTTIAQTVDTTSRAAALKWSVDAHNTVNARLGKPVLSYPEAMQAIVGMCPGNKYQPPSTCAAGSAKLTGLNVAIAVLAVGLAGLLVAVIVLASKASQQQQRRRGGGPEESPAPFAPNLPRTTAFVV
jgi:hypothetical protein